MHFFMTRDRLSFTICSPLTWNECQACGLFILQRASLICSNKIMFDNEDATPPPDSIVETLGKSPY